MAKHTEFGENIRAIINEISKLFVEVTIGCVNSIINSVINYYFEYNFLEIYELKATQDFVNNKNISIGLKWCDIALKNPLITEVFSGTDVTYIDLGWDKIGLYAPEIVQFFEKSHIISVNLEGNYIESDAPETAAAFKNTNITHVNLAYNEIGLYAPATASAFANTKISFVDLSNNNISLEDSIKTLSIIQTSGNITRLAIDHSDSIEFSEQLQIPSQWMHDVLAPIITEEALIDLIGEYLVLEIV